MDGDDPRRWYARDSHPAELICSRGEMGPIASFEQRPATSVPFRFLLTAPVYGVAAGLLLAWLGADALDSRWSSGAVALTHLLTTGFLLQAMFGALLQFLPVAAGGNVWRPKLLAAIVYPLITAGGVLLGASLLAWHPVGLRVAAMLLASGSAGYALAIGTALLSTSATGATVQLLRASILALIVTVGLGVALVQTLVGPLRTPFVETADLHAAWGLGGWALLLFAGVCFYVVPMLQLTPSYPAWVGRVLGPGMLGYLLITSILVVWPRYPQWQAATAGAGLSLAIIFAVTTLWLQQHRRRRRGDATLYFFRSAMLSLLAAGGLYALRWTWDGAQAAISMLIGVLLLVGVLAAAVNGMLYKIIPFVCSLELQRQRAPLAKPSMLQFISSKAMNGQWYLHLFALALLVVSTVLPVLAQIAGVAFAASCALLEWNLVVAVRRYRSLRDPRRASVAVDES